MSRNPLFRRPQQISREKQLVYLERALVNAVNQVGVDIQRACREPYLQKLLPFVSGLGPRKTDALIKAIAKSVSSGGASFPAV